MVNTKKSYDGWVHERPKDSGRMCDHCDIRLGLKITTNKAYVIGHSLWTYLPNIEYRIDDTHTHTWKKLPNAHHLSHPPQTPPPTHDPIYSKYSTSKLSKNNKHRTGEQPVLPKTVPFQMRADVGPDTMAIFRPRPNTHYLIDGLSTPPTICIPCSSQFLFSNVAWTSSSASIGKNS